MKKKKIIIRIGLIILFLSSIMWKQAGLKAQNNMGIGTLSPEISALLDLKASDKGLLVPRMGTAARDLITVSAASNGLLIYNTDCNVFNYYQVDHWVSLDGISISGGHISGIPNPCQSATSVGYKIPTVPGILTYNWTVPSGATITAGQGTDSITVSFGTTSGNICVKASNSCGDSDSLCLAIQFSTTPIAPTGLPASDFTCTSFNANWAVSQDAINYFLDVSTDASFASFITGYNAVNTGNVTTYSVTGLTVNTIYYYRLRVLNGCDTSLNSNTVIVSTSSPIAPTATPPDNFTCTSVNANWGAVQGATGYFLDVSTNAAFSTFITGYNYLSTGNVTTYNVTGLIANTTYYYRVRSGNACDTSLNSNTITFGTTAPIAPTATPPDNFTCTSVNANWGSVQSATGYFLDVSTDAAFATFVTGYNNTNTGNVTTYNVTGLTANTTYYYRIRSDNGCSTSLNSNTITFGTTAPIAPTATPPDNFTCTSVNANWGSVQSATGYFLDVSTDAAFATFVTGYNNTNTGNVTTYNVTGLTANRTYYYRIRSDNGCSTSLNSNTITFGTTAPIAPTATSPDNFTCTSVNANWGSVQSATGYFLDVSTDAAFATFVTGYNNTNTGNVTTYNVTGLTANTTYYYRIRSDNGCSTSLNSNTITFGTTAPIAPTATPPDNFTCTSVNANWGSVQSATGYFLDVSTDAAFATFVTGYNNTNTGNVTTYNVTGLTANTTYYYRIRSDNGCSTSLNSNTITFGTTAPIAPTATPPDNFTCTSVNANWGSVQSATGYFLDVSTDAAFATFVTGYNNTNTGNVTTYNVTGLTANRTYYYRIRSDNGCSTSLNSNTITFGTTAPIAPTATSPDNFTCTSVNANWGSVQSATGYFLDVSTDAAFATFVTGYNNTNTGNVTTYNVTGLTANTTYYYRIRSDNGCSTSLNSNTITFGTTAPIAPTATPPDNFTCTSVNANWGSVQSATGYFLDVSTDAAFATFVTGYNNTNTGNVTTYNVTGLTANRTYYYRIRSDNGCSTSLNSNTITFGTTAPIAPTATSPDNFTCTSVNANWGSVQSATGYFLDVSTDAAFATFVTGYNNTNTGNVTTYNVTGLTANTTYYYRIRSDNGCSTSLNSNTITFGTTAPIAPTATSPDNFTCTSVNANWGSVQSATGYFLDVSTDAAFATFVTGYNNTNTGNVTTYNVTGLTANTTYYYRIRSDNGCSTSLNSNTITFGTTAPIAPTATSPDNFTCTSVNANWGSVQSATGYFLDVSTDAAFATFVTGYNNTNTGNVTTYNVTGLTANTTYYYRIRSDNGCSTSLNSNTITFGTTAPIAPTATSPDNFTCTSVNANWGAVQGATGYFLDISTDAAFATFVTGYNNVNTGDVTTYNIIGLTVNTTYYYRVRSDNGCSTSLNSNTIVAVTSAPSAPTAVAASNFTCTSMNANWAASVGATSYFLDVATDAAFATFVTGYNSVNTSNVTTFNITGLTVNTTYYYRVRASNGCNTSLNSNTIIVSTSAPIAPSATSADNFTCTSFNANWGALQDATSYFLDVSTSAAFGTFVGTYSNLNVNNVTTYNITGLTAGTTYYYRVRASNGCSTSLNSNSIVVITAGPLAPTATSASNFTCTSLNANWSAPAGATGYFLDVSTDAAFATFLTGYNNLNINNVTTYNITGLTVNTTYYYRIRASNGCSISLNSNTILVSTTSPISPTATSATNFTCTSLNANWGAVSGATTYYIDVSTNVSFTNFLVGYNNLNAGNINTINITGLTVNATYYYRVRAANGCSTSLNSNTITVTTAAPISPTAVAASNFTCTSLNANWGAVSGATGYFLDVSSDASFTTFVTGYNNVNVGDVTTYNVTGLTINTSYYYRVRAANGCSTSLNSNTIFVVTSAPFAPVGISADNFTCTSMNANWGPVSAATAYYLDVSTTPSFSTLFGTYNNLNVNNVTTYNITGLTLGTTYYYRVRAGNGCSTSSNSNTINAVMSAPEAPQALSPSNVICTSLNANWGAATGAITYYLDVSTDASFATFVTGYNNLNVNNITTYNVTGLSAGVTYYYRVRAANGCSSSLNSNFVSVVTSAITAPVAFAASSIACTNMNVNWGSVSGVIGYILDISTSPSFVTFLPGYSNLSVGNVLTYGVTGLTVNTTYYYRVRAMGGCTTSPNSNTITASTNAPDAPVATGASNVTCTSMNANWSSVSSAITYYLDVAIDASFTSFVTGYNNFNVGNVTTYNVTGLTGITVYYRVRAASGCASGANSNFIMVNPSAVDAPIAVGASGVACTVFNANWIAASGAISYFLDVTTDPGFGSFVAGYNNKNVGNITSYNVTGLTVNTAYYYRVRSMNACATSTNSNIISTGTYAPNAPNASAGTNVTCSSLSANWSAVGGAITYYLDVANDPGFTSFVAPYNDYNVGNVTSYNITGLTGTTIYYRVRAASGCASGGNSNLVLVNPSAIDAPVARAASGITCTVFNANWNAVSGAINYFIDVSLDPAFSSFVGVYNNLNVHSVTTFNVTGLSADNFYYYRIRAMSGCATSLNSNTITASTHAPNAPVAAGASNLTCSTMNANWNASSGALYYYLDVSMDPAFGSFLPSYNNVNVGNVLTYNVTGLVASTVYYYRVRAVNGCSTSGNSNIIIAATTPPAQPGAYAVTSYTCTSFVASWTAVSGATSYTIDVSNDAAFGTFIVGYNNLNVGNVTALNITGLSAGVTYYYRVRTNNNCGTSSSSNSVAYTIDAPTIPQPTTWGIGCTSFSFCWPLTSGATNYLLDISTNASFTSFVAGYNNLSMGNVSCYNATGLTNGINYYYRIRAGNACGSSGNSTNLVIPLYLPGAPTVTDAPLTAISCTSFTAVWTQTLGATSYFLDVSTSPTFASFVGVYSNFNAGSLTSFNVTSLSPNTTYYYRVRGANGCGSSSNSARVTVITAVPTVPVASAASSINVTDFVANWAAASNATTYYLDVATDPGFASYVTGYNNINVGNVTSFHVTGLTTGTSYYYRVRASNGCNTSGNSGLKTLTTL